MFPQQLSGQQIFEAAPDLPGVQPNGGNTGGNTSQASGLPQSPTCQETSCEGLAEQLPSQIDASTHSTVDSTPSSRAEHLAYRLAAVVVHDGNVASGHYTTFRAVYDSLTDPQADPQPAVEKCVWFRVSDASVRRSCIGEVLAAEATMLVYIVND